MSAFSPALQPAPILAIPTLAFLRSSSRASSSDRPSSPLRHGGLTRLRPVAVRATTLPQSVAAAETGALQPKPAVEAETAEPLDSVVVVSRDARGVERGTCALCWSGPEPMAGTVRRISATNSETRVICSRCLVTLEMLAVQFDPQLELHVETPA